MTRVAVNFDDLFDAFEFVSAGQPYEHEAYLCTETGVIHYHSEFLDPEEDLPDDIDTSERYIAIPHKNDLDLGKRLALRFAYDLLPDEVGDVNGIFRRKGAYRRFKDLLERRGLLQQWYEYEEKSQTEALREWCEVSGIEIQGQQPLPHSGETLDEERGDTAGTAISEHETVDHPGWEAEAAAALRRLALDEEVKRYVLEHGPLYESLLRAAKRFIGGERLSDAIEAAKRLNGQGHAVAIEYMGESTRSAAAAAEATDEFLRVVETAAKGSLETSVALDLSHIGLVVDEDLCFHNASGLADAARQAGMEMMISAEGVERTDAVLRLHERLCERFDNVGVTLQAYLYRTPDDLAAVVQRPGKIRIVKGAFEAPAALAMPRGDELNAAYLRVIEALLAHGHRFSIATHDAALLERAHQSVQERDTEHAAVEFEMLKGIAPDLLQRFQARGYRTRVYLPYGTEWYLYLCNRLAECPPNVYRALSDAVG